MGDLTEGTVTTSGYLAIINLRNMNLIKKSAESALM